MANDTEKRVLALDDALLGFIGAHTPPSATIDKTVRFLSTYSGTDKFLMAVQYLAKVLAPFILYRAQLQHRAGKRPKPVSLTTEGLFKFAGQVSAARRIMGFPNILHFIQALSALERKPPASKFALNLGRIQCLSMLVFYPLEYVAFFTMPSSGPLLRIPDKAAVFAMLWSVRAWGVFTVAKVVEQAAGLREVLRKERELLVDEKERIQLSKQKQKFVHGLLANVSRLPVILHWSVVGGIYRNEMITNGLSLFSALAAVKGGWEVA